MVCKTCEKKLATKSSAPDPYRNRGVGGSLLKGKGAAASNRVGPQAKGASSSTNKLLGAKHKYTIGAKCKLCRANVSQEHAKYCQACAYKKGLCAICGKIILDTSKYKQSVA